MNSGNQGRKDVTEQGNFDAKRMVGFIEDWVKTEREIKRLTATHIAPLREHLRDSRKLAKEDGFSVAVMKEIVADRIKLESREEADELDDDRAYYREMVRDLLKEW